jgi:hypothetical protein
MEPLYEHDCSACVFQGTIDNRDIYVCTNDFGPTVVVRHSSDGPDYSSSSMILGYDTDDFKGLRVVKVPGTEDVYLTVGLRKV